MSTGKLRVLFVCVGNACRSQMAEAFARVNGAAVVEPASAGLAPAFMIPEITHAVMREKGIDLTGQSPKPLAAADFPRFDLIINLSGAALPAVWAAKVRDWKVPDPIGMSEKFHREVRDQIEALVQGLLLQARNIAAALPVQASEAAAATDPAGPPVEAAPRGSLRQRSRPKLLRG